jgi:hypothetical protein
MSIASCGLSRDFRYNIEYNTPRRALLTGSPMEFGKLFGGEVAQ